MKKFYFLFFISFSLSAQIRAVVKDSISGQPIPYVNIWVENETIGTTSEIDGSFVLDVKKGEKLFFSALGYETNKTDSNKEVFFLKPKMEELKEVVIKHPKFRKEIEIGSFSKPLGNLISGDLEWSNAKYFKYETAYEQTRFLNKIKISTRSKVNNAKFKIRIFSINKQGLPDADLLSEDIIVTVKKGTKKNVIDISDFQLVFPIEGIFVAYEVLKIESNKYIFEYTENENKKIIQKTYYAPDFQCNLVEEQNTYHYRLGKWNNTAIIHNIEKGSRERYNNKVLEPAINLILTN